MLATIFSYHLSPHIGEGNGNPLQCSCLENPRDGGAWWAAIYGVAQSQTRLKQLSSSITSRSYKFFSLWWELWRSTLLTPPKYTIQYCQLQSPCCISPRLNWSSNCQFVFFDRLYPVTPLSILSLTNNNLISVSMWFFSPSNSTYEWDYTVFVFVCLTYLA